MRQFAVLFLFLLLPLPAAAPVLAGEPRIDWLDSQGQPRWSIELDTPVEGAGQMLEAEEWFPPLPRIALPLIDGSSSPKMLPLESLRGDVLVLDFWASWCAPCLKALPSLQRLVAARKGRGLTALAVNVDEDDETVMRFAGALELELPVMRLTPGMDRLLDIKTLPTTLVVDRQGRIRARFNGSHPELEARLTAAVDRLLDGAELPRQSIATVHRGRARVSWSQELNGSAQSVAAMPDGAAVGRALLGLVGWDVVGLDADGRLRVNKRAGSGYESMVLSSVREGGGVGIYTFRRFGKRLAPVEFGPQIEPPLEFDDHLLDVRPDAGAGSLWLGTTKGLRRVDPRGAVEKESGAFGAVWGIGPPATSRPVLALGEQTAIHWLDADLNAVESTPVFAEARRLLGGGDPAGIGVGSQEIVGWAVGNFLGGDRQQLAAAANNRLYLVDLQDGTVDFHAEWPEIRGLSAYDPASTGRAMLAVASAKRITLVTLDR